MILLCTSFVSLSKHVNAINVLMSTIAWTRIHSFCCFGFEVPVHEHHFFVFFLNTLRSLPSMSWLQDSQISNKKTKNQRLQTEKKHTPSHPTWRFISVRIFFCPRKIVDFRNGLALEKTAARTDSVTQWEAFVSCSKNWKMHMTKNSVN